MLGFKLAGKRWYLYLGIFLFFGIIVRSILTGGIRHFFVQPYSVPASSREPTLLVGDHIFVAKFKYRNSEPKRGDVIVFEFPEDSTKNFLKRVVGMAGDVLKMRDNRGILNGEELVEQYVELGPSSRTENRSFDPIKIPEKSLFVLGDNRDYSYDSRDWGCLKRDKVKGKVINVYWSWDSEQYSVRWNRIGKQIK